MLYLVSTDSLTSDKRNKEIASALGNKKCCVPIILRECDWKRHKVGRSSISDFQALPKDGKPIKSWKDKDKVWQDVIDGIRKILDTEKEQEDTSQSILFKSGNAKYMLGALDEALVNYTEAIELEPDYAEAYYSHGNVLLELKQYDKAEADYNKAIELEPDAVAVYYGRGLLFTKKALMDFAKAMELKRKPNAIRRVIYIATGFFVIIFFRLIM